ncbi:MAG: hypothetical protein CMH52_12090 [Myxococcales bacterium]|nr:hypothetical protein [Myxococcales bacterium]
MKRSLLLLIGVSTLCHCGGQDQERAQTLADSFGETLDISHDAPEHAFLGVWGMQETVYVVGGTVGESGGVVLKKSGETFFAEDVAAGPLLWWIHGSGPDSIWAVGEQGRILRKGSTGWSDESVTFDEKLVLWGVWAASATDVWAVGGSVRRGGPKGVVLRSTGDGQWRRIDDEAFPSDLNFYKVWGQSADEVYIVGEGGVGLVFNGTEFKRLDTGVRDLLFTVHGGANNGQTSVYAVGGANMGMVFRRENADAETWVQESIPAVPGLNGVAVVGHNTVFAVGNRGVMLLRTGNSQWQRITNTETNTVGLRTLHAVGKYGRVWSVGGDLTDMTNGIILNGQLSSE